MSDIDQQDTRPIPPLPGGGSWHFDDKAWAWVSNDSAPVEPAAQAAAATETPSADQE